MFLDGDHESNCFAEEYIDLAEYDFLTYSSPSFSGKPINWFIQQGFSSQPHGQKSWVNRTIIQYTFDIV